jgi:hypothetical protein
MASGDPTYVCLAQTDDGETVLLHYIGLVQQADIFKQAATNKPTDWGDQYMRLAMRFDTGAERYRSSSILAVRRRGRLLGTVVSSTPSTASREGAEVGKRTGRDHHHSLSQRAWVASITARDRLWQQRHRRRPRHAHHHRDGDGRRAVSSQATGRPQRQSDRAGSTGVSRASAGDHGPRSARHRAQPTALSPSAQGPTPLQGTRRGRGRQNRVNSSILVVASNKIKYWRCEW